MRRAARAAFGPAIVAALVAVLTQVLSAQSTPPLHRAVIAGDRAAVERLIRAGADVNAATRHGVTPLSLAAQRGNADLVGVLLQAGAAVARAEATLPDGQTLLMHAARTGNVAAVKALIAAGSNLNARETRTGTTALIWAATADRAEAIRVLAEAGADLDLTDPEGTTALIIAVINGHYDVVSVLLEKGADPDIADIKGMTPLYAAVDMHTIGDTFGRPYPVKAVIDGSLDAARALIKAGASVNARLKAPILKRVYDAGDSRLGEGSTPFMRAARKCDVEMMRILLDAGADVTLTQKSGNTPLILCAGAVSGGGGEGEDTPDRVSEAEALAAIRLMLDAGVDVNAQNTSGDTALHTAATAGGGQPAIFRLLVERGARLDLKNKADRTPLEAARRARQPNQKVVALLEEAAR